jgi:hypothetical protein
MSNLSTFFNLQFQVSTEADFNHPVIILGVQKMKWSFKHWW